MLDPDTELYSADPVRRLDLQITYLRKVHALCYYSCEEYDDERLLAAKCGPVYIRSKDHVPVAKLAEHPETSAFESRIEKFVSVRIAAAKVSSGKTAKVPSVSSYRCLARR